MSVFVCHGVRSGHLYLFVIPHLLARKCYLTKNSNDSNGFFSLCRAGVNNFLEGTGQTAMQCLTGGPGYQMHQQVYD